MRDASAQISDAPENKVTVHNTKWKAIARGVEIKNGIGEFEFFRHYCTTTELATLLAWLTSTDKTERGMAKQQVRELVRLGRGAQA